MKYIYSLIIAFALFIGISTFTSQISLACCSNADCDGATCEGAGPGCPLTPGSAGSCSGGGQECGGGIGSSCPSGYTCSNGNCINDGSGGGPGTGNQGGDSYNPFGTHVVANCTVTTGWACDQGYYDEALSVQIWKSDTPTGTKSLLSTVSTRIDSGCGNGTDNRDKFSYTIPDSLKNGVTHYLHAMAINKGSGSAGGTWLGGTPLSINCSLKPKGVFAAAGCTNFRGWACDPSNYSASVPIHFYKDGPAGSGTFIGNTTTSSPYPNAVSSCQGNPNAGFYFNTPASLKDGVSHTIYAYAINIGSGSGNTLLTNSPRTIQCAAACNTTAATGVTTTTLSSTSVRVNWTPGTGGASQRFRMGESLAEVNAGCPGTTGEPACDASAVLSTAANSYTVSGLKNNTTYYYSIVQYSSASCYANADGTYTTGAAACTVTAPTNLTTTPLSSTSVRLNWTRGTGGIQQNILGGTSPTCTASTCEVSATVSSTTSSYTASGLNPNTVYYWRVINYESATCTAQASVYDVSSCSLSPSSLNLTVGGAGQLITANVNSSSAIDRVEFSSDSPSVSVSPATDSSYSYRTTATAVQAGEAVVSARVYIAGQSAAVCTASSPGGGDPPGGPGNPEIPPEAGSNGTVVTSNGGANSAWWQAKDSDITASGDITSTVASSNVLIDDGAGGFPGAPVFSGSLDYAPGGLSSTDWQANTATALDRQYDYSYFENLVPNDITFADASTSSLTSGGTAQDGYYWYKFDGTSGATLGQDMTISSNLNLAGRKVVLFVKGADLNINGRINLDDGSGFFAAIVEGDIRVGGSVTGTPSIEGLYLTNSRFISGVGTSQLHVRGSVGALGGLTLTNQRDLADDSSPSELFEYAPDQMMLFPNILATKKTKWVEKAP